MKKNVWMMSALLGMSVWSCDQDKDLTNMKSVDSNFEQNNDGWAVGFAEYGEEQDSTIFEFNSRLAALPAPLDTTKKAIRVQSHNRSDDVFMYLKKKVSGLDPNRTYKVTYEIDLGTNYAKGSVGIGGSPAESVYLKAGASPNEPVTKLVDGFYEVTIDKGQQATGGTEMSVLGNVSNGLDSTAYKVVQRSNTEAPVAVKPNANGEIWLCVGTDSGFEGLTVLYYDRIKVMIRE
ncbi:hypothetical protein [Persicitalea jodogahamensis]|uniref:Uncharacterized protein n=1 Tax=Persicitalea jodogahamensis TaxID=402147 RepID=A0A8J3D1T1_9BACT|nr:hypothetical protein [Persicitalea jodogahamensis]GHB54762.1 hypothetical protein GCM10007390_04850 [Persicitalea jodogahamensis]